MTDRSYNLLAVSIIVTLVPLRFDELELGPTIGGVVMAFATWRLWSSKALFAAAIALAAIPFLGTFSAPSHELNLKIGLGMAVARLGLQAFSGYYILTLIARDTRCGGHDALSVCALSRRTWFILLIVASMTLSVIPYYYFEAMTYAFLVVGLLMRLSTILLVWTIYGSTFNNSDKPVTKKIDA